MSQEVVGFILQPTYRIESGRAVVCLYGTLEGGGSFLVRDRRHVPGFYVRLVDAGRARDLGARPLDPSPMTTLAGEPVARIDVAVPGDTPSLRTRLVEAGIPCYEADIRFAMGFLMDRGIRGAIRIRGDSKPGHGIDHVFEDPILEPAEFAPALSVLSFDIETDPKASELLAVSLDGCGASEVMLRCDEGLECPEGAIGFPDERSLIRAFAKRVRELDPDVLTGWNIVDFDLPVLKGVARRLGVPFEIGRGAGEVRILTPRSSREATRASVPGRSVLDGLMLVRGAFVRFEEYSLDFVANEVLGTGKVVSGGDRGAEILRMFHEDRARFVEYSATDARLVTQILEKLRLVELAVERSLLTGLPPERVSASVAAFDFLYLSELHRRGVVAPTVDWSDGPSEPNAGGAVLEPVPGLHDRVLVFDFKSLYPSVVRTFQIDPLGYIDQADAPEDAIVAPNGAAFRRGTGILTGMLDELFPRRDAAKREGNPVRSQAIKILMNSFYGVLGTPASRFHSGPLSNAITSFGREILRWSRTRIESLGHRVLYGDTDSLFVQPSSESAEDARAIGERLAARLNAELAEHVRRTWNVESRLELEFETLYLRLLLPTMRHASTGARKRYAGLVERDGGTEVVFTGLEVVRRDWTDLAKNVQRELYDRLFHDRPIGEFLRDIVRDLRAGRLDEQLVYRKGLRKDPADYVRSTPPHVVAARKMSGPPGRIVSYVVTQNGPEPADERKSPYDYDHYVRRQIQPVTEPVIQQLDLEFDVIAGLDRQMRLF